MKVVTILHSFAVTGQEWSTPFRCAPSCGRWHELSQTVRFQRAGDRRQRCGRPRSQADDDSL